MIRMIKIDSQGWKTEVFCAYIFFQTQVSNEVSNPKVEVTGSMPWQQPSNPWSCMLLQSTPEWKYTNW